MSTREEKEFLFGVEGCRCDTRTIKNTAVISCVNEGKKKKNKNEDLNEYNKYEVRSKLSSTT